MAAASVAGDPLTARQAEILDFYLAFYQDIGVPPTFREIMDEFGLAGTNGVWVLIKPLVQKGRLRALKAGTARGYVPVVPAGCCPCCGRPRED